MINKVDDQEKIINKVEEALLIKTNAINSKDEIIENLKFKIDNLEGCALHIEISNLTSDISTALENTNKIKEGVSCTDEIQNNSRPVPNSKNLNTLPVQLVDGNSTNTEINSNTPNTIEGNDVNGDLQRANSKLVDEYNSLKEIAKQEKEKYHEQERRLHDMSIICNKTELAYNAQRELVETKDQLIELQKDTINCQKTAIASLTSTGKDVVLMVDQSTEVIDATLRPLNIENGLITNALLLWLDIQRKTTAENIWKTQALSHFTEEEITDAKNMLWSNCDELLIGKHIRRQGTSKTNNELEDISAALRMLDEIQKMPTFIASSEMVMKTPSFNANTAECNNDALATRIQILEETISTALRADKGNIFHGKRDTIQGHFTNENTAVNCVHNKTKDKHVSWADVVTTNVRMPHIDLNTNTPISKGFTNRPMNKQSPATHTRMQTPILSTFVSGNGIFQEPVTESVYQGQIQNRSNGIEYYDPVNQILHDGIQKGPEKSVVYGTKDDTSLTAADVEIVVFGVAKDVTCYQIATYAEEQGIKIINCELLTNWSEARSNTFKLTVKANQTKTALCESVWPFGVGVRRFRQHKGNRLMKAAGKCRAGRRRYRKE